MSRPNRQNVAMLVYSYYPADPRVRREATALVDAGFEVDVFSLRAAHTQKMETFEGVSIHRLRMKRSRKGALSYILNYSLFILLAFFKLAAMHSRRRYAIVHVHNMPDALVFSALVPKLLGAKVILDLHDPMPELYMTKFDISEDHVVVRLLRFFEKLSIGFADIVITPNQAFRDLFVARSCAAEKIHIVMNSPDEALFGAGSCRGESPRKQSSAAGEEVGVFRVMYHGTIVERHGLDTALEAIVLLGEAARELEFHVYGEGEFEDRFLELVTEHTLGDRVEFHGRVSLKTIVEEINKADVGIIPNKRSPFTEVNFPTRIFEYLARNKPTIAPRTRGIGDYFGEGDLLFFEPGDASSLAEAISRVHRRSRDVEEVLRRGAAVYRAHRWELQRRELTDVVERLVGQA